MTFDYTKPRATAERLIKRFGQSVTLRQKTSSGPAHNPTIVNVDNACTGLVLEYNSNEIDGTLILTGDKKLMLSTQGLSVTPNASDTMIIDGHNHTIEDIAHLSPAGTVILWEIQIRK